MLFLAWVIWSANTRGAQEFLGTVRKGDSPASRCIQIEFGPESPDGNAVSGHQGFLRDAASEQRVRGAAFDEPVYRGSVFARCFHMQPCMRINPLYFGDYPLQFERA